MSHNSHNNQGGYPTTTEAMMRAFDKLPRTVRMALANSVENWVPQPIRTRFERGQWTAPECLKRIAKWNADELAKREYQRSRAIDVYRGNAPDLDPMKARRRRRRRRS